MINPQLQDDVLLVLDVSDNLEHSMIVHMA
jgi:hypothetical protein